MKNKLPHIKLIKSQVKIPAKKCSCIYAYMFYTDIKCVKINIIKFCKRSGCGRTLTSGDISYNTFYQMRKVFNY